MLKIIILHNTIWKIVHKYSQDTLLLIFRIYISMAFFSSGLLKIGSWDSTLYLFENEYEVPLLPWQIAAYLGTAAELILPVFLSIGLFSRIIATKLFLFNIVAVISYPTIWQSGFFMIINYGAC